MVYLFEFLDLWCIRGHRFDWEVSHEWWPQYAFIGCGGTVSNLHAYSFSNLADFNLFFFKKRDCNRHSQTSELIRFMPSWCCVGTCVQTKPRRWVVDHLLTKFTFSPFFSCLALLSFSWRLTSPKVLKLWTQVRIFLQSWLLPWVDETEYFLIVSLFLLSSSFEFYKMLTFIICWSIFGVCQHGVLIYLYWNSRLLYSFCACN